MLLVGTNEAKKVVSNVLATFQINDRELTASDDGERCLRWEVIKRTTGLHSAIPISTRTGPHAKSSGEAPSVIRETEQNLGNGSRGLGPVELPDRYDMGTDARLNRRAMSF